MLPRFCTGAVRAVAMCAAAALGMLNRDLYPIISATCGGVSRERRRQNAEGRRRDEQISKEVGKGFHGTTVWLEP